MAGEIKEKAWKEMRKMEKGKALDLVGMSRRVGCTLSYLSQISKHAFDCGFLKFNKDGDYAINRIPKNYEDFKSDLNQALYSHREKVAGSRGPKRQGQQRNKAIEEMVEKIEVNEETIVPLIQNLINKARNYKELEEKYKKLIEYAKVIKEERDILRKEIGNIDEIE